jgi:hypothetical protein
MSEEDKYDPDRSSKLKLTQIAAQGLDTATLFTAKYMRHNINGFVPKMREPAGISTEGGKQATQHIVLEPKTPGEANITIGQANLATKTAKIRTFDCLERLHKQRFAKKPFPLDQPTYQKFFDEALAFLRKHELNVEIETQPPDMSSLPPPGMPAPAAGSSSTPWIAFVALVVIAAVVMWLVASGRLHLGK